MSRLKIIFSFVLSLLLVAAMIRADSSARREGPEAEEEEHGPFPSDWFMRQRTWPDQTISPADLIAASEQAARLKARSLDQQPPWIQAGPSNICGRVADIAGNPLNSDVFYVASASGGIFKTTDGGTSWQAIADNLPSQSMGALALDPEDPDILYAGTGEACSAGYSYFGTGIYRTTDDGANWTHLGLSETRYITRIVVDPTDTQILWVAAMGELYITNSERGLYRSTDSGQSWERKLFINDTTGASDVVIDPVNPQIIYAATWQRIRNGEWRISGGYGSGIYKSTDSGETWEHLQDGLPEAGPDVGRIGLTICATSPDVLYAIYADDPGYFLGIYKTTNGGDNWARVNDGSLSDMFSNFGWYFGNIRVRPDNPNIVFALGVPLVRSTNGGNSWTTVSQSVHVDQHALWFDPLEPQRILIGNDGGVYRSTNNGSGWQYLNGIPNIQFYAAAVCEPFPEQRYGGTQDNGTLRTTTGADYDWERILGGDGFYALVDPTDPDVVYAEYQWGYLRKSTNGGSNWHDILSGIDENERRNWSTPVAMAPDDPQTLYYGAERLYRSTDGGGEWQPISPDLTSGGGSGNITFGTITTIGVSSVNSDVIYVGTDDANVWGTPNGGESWNYLIADLPERWITRVTPDAREENVVYVTLSGFRNAEQDAHLFRSEDYGLTWRNISGDLPVGPLNDVVPDPDIPQRLYAASDFGAFVSVDLGDHWIALGEQLPRVPVIQFVLNRASRQLFAATYGRSMLVLNLDELELNRPPQILDSSPALIDTIDVPATIEFRVTATDPDGDSLSYEWRRGETVIGTDSAVTVEFTEPGTTERVVVTVSDGELTAERSWEIVVTGLGADEAFPLPERWFVASSYPNPFNSTTTVEFELPQPSSLEIAVFDLAGRRVAELFKGEHPSGRGRVTWSADGAASET